MRIEIPEGVFRKVFPEARAVYIYDPHDVDCIAYVCTDEGNVHFALELQGGIVAFEHVPDNEPATSAAFYASREEWREAVEEVAWIKANLPGGEEEEQGR